jgi:CrcB protein
LRAGPILHFHCVVMQYLWIALGSAAGGVSRFAIASAIGARGGFPYGTMIVNISGAILIGLVSALLSAGKMTPSVAQFWMVGVLGGYTTFSAFSLQSLELLQQSRFGAAMLYMLGSVVLCLAGVWAGQFIGRSLR